MDGLRHLPVHRLRRRGAAHLLRTQHLPPDRDYGADQRAPTLAWPRGAQISCGSDSSCVAGGGLHRAGGGGGGQEAGADQGGEARSQLHDGLAHLQEGNGKNSAVVQK